MKRWENNISESPCVLELCGFFFLMWRAAFSLFCAFSESQGRTLCFPFSRPLFISCFQAKITHAPKIVKDWCYFLLLLVRKKKEKNVRFVGGREINQDKRKRGWGKNKAVRRKNNGQQQKNTFNIVLLAKT